MLCAQASSAIAGTLSAGFAKTDSKKGSSFTMSNLHTSPSARQIYFRTREHGLRAFSFAISFQAQPSFSRMRQNSNLRAMPARRSWRRRPIDCNRHGRYAVVSISPATASLPGHRLNYVLLPGEVYWLRNRSSLFPSDILTPKQ